jgi:hypothetical protein
MDAAQLVEVELVTEPEGATVRIGGAVWGVTPLSAFLPTNQHPLIELELAGYRSTRARWNPTAGEHALHVTLVPLESP